jgi:predicted esterase
MSRDAFGRSNRPPARHRRNRLAAWSFAFAWLAATVSPAAEPPKVGAASTAPGLLPPKTGWPAKPQTGSRKVSIDGVDDPDAYFLLSVPEAYSPEQSWPLMIVLHGSGGHPDAMASVFRAGLTQRGVINLFPKALKNQMLDWNYPHSGAYFLMILRQLAKEYRIDPRRLYLAGHSMGGGGTWAQGAVLRDLWAAVGPMSGWYRATPAPPAEWLAGLPVYCVHGAQDHAVPAQLSRRAFEDLKKIGNTTQTYTEFPDPKQMGNALCVYREIPDAGHDVFTPWAKRGAPEVGLMVAWMLNRQRPQPANLAAAEQRLAEWGKRFHWTPDGKLGKYADEEPRPKGGENGRAPTNKK